MIPQSIPARLAKRLQHYPVLLAQVLGVRNRVARLASALATRRGVLLLLLTGAAVVGVASVVLAGPGITTAATWIAHHDVLLAALGAVHAFLTVMRRRAHVTVGRAHSWLAPLPQSPSAARRSDAVQILWPILGQWLLLVLISGTLAAAVPHLGSRLMVALAWVSGAMMLGGATAWRWPRTRVERREDSRYVRDARAMTLRPSLAGLSRWPIAQAVAWHRPENSRVLFLVAALSVPLGTSALMGIGLVAFWTLASYLTALLTAVQTVARQAAEWLRATPIGFFGFAWAIARRALLHQLAGTLLVGGVLVLIGAPPAAAARLCALWLAIVVCASTIGLAQAYRARPGAARVAIALVASVVTEFRAHGWGISLALALAAAHVRGASKHVRT